MITSIINLVKGPLRPLKRRWVLARRRRAHGALAPYLANSERIAGWARGPEAFELAQVAAGLPGDPVIVEIGSFLGSSAVLLGGARKLAGNGVVHCVDPLDASGDQHSVPFYEELTRSLGRSMRAEFDANMAQAGVSEYVCVHEGTAEEIGKAWARPIDMLFLDGDQSPEGARSAFDVWSPFLKPGGIIAVHNSSDRTYSPEHDGQRRVVVESIITPSFADARCIGTTTFARKAS